uniref:Uncharacterized protein n=1 Tax=Anopheles culicifacies TaxID=139723 RepID=A0A182MKL8_9DIPT
MYSVTNTYGKHIELLKFPSPSCTERESIFKSVKTRRVAILAFGGGGKYLTPPGHHSGNAPGSGAVSASSNNLEKSKPTMSGFRDLKSTRNRIVSLACEQTARMGFEP